MLSAQQLKPGQKVRVRPGVPSFGGMVGEITRTDVGNKIRVHVSFYNNNTANTFNPEQLDPA